MATVAFLVGLGVHVTAMLDALERRSIDQRFVLRGWHGPDAGIVIVALDQRSLTDLNQRLPIQRRLYAQLLDRLGAAGPRLIAMDVQFIGATDSLDDDALVAAITRHGPMVLATHDGPDGPVPVPAGRTDVYAAVPASVGVDVDADAVLRRMMYAQVTTRTFPVRVAELLTGEEVAESDFPENHAWIDFAGPPGTYLQYSFVDVLNGTVGADDLGGKTVLVGVTDPTARDVFVTSVSSVPMAGVEIQANSVATILDGLPLREPNWSVDILIVLLCAALPAILAGRIAALPLLGVGLGLLALYLVAVQLAFNGGLILAVVPALVTLILAIGGAATVDSLSEKRRRAELEATLADLPTEFNPAFFISYRRDQTSWPAQALKDELEKRFGPGAVFMDLQSIHAGQDWEARIRGAIKSCSAVLVLIGNYWLEARDDIGGRRVDDPKDWVRREIEEALDAPGVTLVPILLDGAQMPAAEKLPESLAELPRRYAYSLSAARWAVELDELVKSLRTDRLGEALRRPTTGDVTHPDPSRPV